MFEDFRLRVFITVAQEGSFTLAARKLHVSQPAVSQNIAELEKTLGTVLFERLRGEVRLTDAGSLFKGYAEQILHWYGAAADAFSSSDEAGNNPIESVKLPLDDLSEAEIWSHDGDLHIKINRK